MNPKRTIVATISEAEHAELVRRAREYDRSLVGELRRAIRFYLSDFDVVDRALRERALGREHSGAAS
jgi:hypothetical protein